MNITHPRLNNQQIAAHQFTRPSQVIAWLGAVQAQDFNGAKWSVGLRLPGAAEADIDSAIADRSIVRTWPMRGTLHFVAAADVHWMLALLAPRTIAGSAALQRRLELDETVFAQCEKIFIRALEGGKQLSRPAMYALLEEAHISTAGMRGNHILWRLSQEGLLCFGLQEVKQQAFALLDEWCPAHKSWGRDESLAELARRYFTSHGPATLQDFVWWSGLKVSDARAGLSMAVDALNEETFEGQTYWLTRSLQTSPNCSPTAFLLPGFDEYMLGYKDRSASLDPKYAQRICPSSNGLFLPTIVIDGHVRGTWKRTSKNDSVTITLSPFDGFSNNETPAITMAVHRYGEFIGKTACVDPLS